jgi:hypothetical protein
MNAAGVMAATNCRDILAIERKIIDIASVAMNEVRR